MSEEDPNAFYYKKENVLGSLNETNTDCNQINEKVFLFFLKALKHFVLFFGVTDNILENDYLAGTSCAVFKSNHLPALLKTLNFCKQASSVLFFHIINSLFNKLVCSVQEDTACQAKK